MIKGGETAEAYLEKSGLNTMCTKIFDGCCREVPDKLGPFIVQFMLDNYSKSAKASVAIRSGADRGKWMPRKDFKLTNKLLLDQYLEDLQVRSTLQRIMEKAVLLRPTNVAALAVDIMLGTDSHLQDAADEEGAAKTLQARQRGANARKEQKQQKAAATKVQARQRGKNARKKKPSEPTVEEGDESISMGD